MTGTGFADVTMERAHDVRLLAFYSPKGGTGTSTLAQSVAIQLARGGARTLLIDFALFGATCVTLRLKQAGTGLSAIISAIDRDESLRTGVTFPNVVASSLSTFTFPGGSLDLLLGAPPAAMERLKLEDAEALLAQAARSHQFVVVDTSPELSERNMAALLRADRVVLIATPDVGAGWALYQFEAVLGALAIPREKVGLVVNRARSDVRFAPQDLSEAIGVPQLGLVRDRYKEIQSAVNDGAAAVLRVKSLHRDVADLLPQIIPGRERERRRGLWRWIG